jgi:hypothetical protein
MEVEEEEETVDDDDEIVSAGDVVGVAVVALVGDEVDDAKLR